MIQVFNQCCWCYVPPVGNDKSLAQSILLHKNTVSQPFPHQTLSLEGEINQNIVCFQPGLLMVKWYTFAVAGQLSAKNTSTWSVKWKCSWLTCMRICLSVTGVKIKTERKSSKYHKTNKQKANNSTSKTFGGKVPRLLPCLSSSFFFKSTIKMFKKNSFCHKLLV